MLKYLRIPISPWKGYIKIDKSHVSNDSFESE